jgi:hypothetical protein
MKEFSNPGNERKQNPFTEDRDNVSNADLSNMSAGLACIFNLNMISAFTRIANSN